MEEYGNLQEWSRGVNDASGTGETGGNIILS